jgi:hypothetical protein
MSWLRLMEEGLHENEPALEHGDDEQVAKPSSGKKHGFARLIEDMWPAYVIEILVIILGISITLALEQWRDGVKESRLEQVYLKNLVADVGTDQKSLTDVIVQTQRLLGRGNDLLQFAGDHNKIIYSQINTDIREIVSRPKFISNDATFSDLKSSGNLHLLRDIKLKNLLFAYYNQTQIIRDVQEAEQLATITLSGPYFFKHFSLSEHLEKEDPAAEKNISEAVNSVEFSNNVLLRLSNRRELVERYQNADSLALQLLDLLDKKTE